MKKTLILASLLAFSVGTQCIAAEKAAPSTTPKKEVCCEKQAPAEMQRPPKGPDCKCNKDRKAEFEKRLKLTDEQKAKAKAIREKGHEQMKPIMENIKTKHEELKTLRASAETASGEKIDAIRAELKDLRKQAHELRMKNMKEFESILTDKQLKELKKMKEEGRKNFDREFRKKHGGDLKPPFPPEFGHRPPHHGPAVPPPLENE